MKWIPTVLGVLLGVVLREVGTSAPRWAERLVVRRSRQLGRHEREEFIQAATQRLLSVSGDWTKLIYAYFRLRADNPSAWTPEPVRPIRRLILIAAVPTFIIGLCFALVAAQALREPWYISVLIGIFWALFASNLDLMLLAVPTVSRPRQFIDWLSAAFRALLGTVVAITFVMSLTYGIMMIIYQGPIDSELADKGLDRAGLLDRMRAFDHLRSTSAWVQLVFWVTFLAFLALDLFPLLARSLGASRYSPQPGRHRKDSDNS